MITWMRSKGFFLGGRSSLGLASRFRRCLGRCFRPTHQTLEPLVGAACHFCRQGWRAWVFKKWARSGRHEVSSLPPLNSLSSVSGLTMSVLGCCPLPRLPLSVWVPPSLPPLGITFLALLGLRFVPGGVSRLGSGNTLSGLAIVVLPMPLLNLPVLSWHVSVGL